MMTPTGQGCPNPHKVKFLDKGGAIAHITRTNQNLDRVPRIPYSCVCGYWHCATDKRRATT